jgi:NAD(P)-dependent dehydrogenase (short-subunit alcohol dehydrogenase family)
LDIDNNKLLKAKKYIKSKIPSANIIIYKADITKEDQVQDVYNKLKVRKIFIDILINNAALDPKMDKSKSVNNNLLNYESSFLKKEVDVGLIGAFYCSRIFGSDMAKRKGGAIINIASDLAISGPDQRVYTYSEKINDVKNFKPIGYSIVKTGLLGLNRYLATYWAHKNVRVNCLVPGAVHNTQSKSLIKNIIKRVPLMRLAKKTDYHGAIVFLASDESSYMTGQQLVIDGGRTIW